MASISLAYLLIVTVTLQFSGIIDAQRQLSVPSECADKTICFRKGPDYPQKQIDETLQNNPVNTMMKRSNYDDESEYETGTDDEMNCSTNVTYERPFSVKGERNYWYPVVQSKYFTQRVRHVKCKNEGGQCMKGILLQTDRYKATCETEKGKIDLYVYYEVRNDHEVRNEIKLISVEVSTCCKCTIRDVTKD